MSSEELSLRELYSRALQSASKAESLPTIQDETQNIINSALSDLNVVSKRIDSLGLFSSNEQLEDLSTKDMVFMTVPFIIAEIELNARAIEPPERLRLLKGAHMHLKLFQKLLDDYSIVPEDEKQLSAATEVIDPVKKRALKVAQYKKDSELKSKIAGIRERLSLPEIDTSNSFQVVQSLLAPLSDDEDENDAALRSATLLLLRMQWGQAATHLLMMTRELELLRFIPDEDSRGISEVRPDNDDTWKLDVNSSQQGPAGLLDVNGRVIRPFTILPANVSERARLQKELFQAGHRLPTMGIDEYLELEKERGNIITGGGPQSLDAPTESEQLAIDSEMDGTLAGDVKFEEKRAKDEEWAQYTDTHRRGEGNMMNRG